jgi:hypothetical protein
VRDADPVSAEVARSDLRDAFSRADLPGVVRLLDRHFGPETYSLTALFRDEQRQIIASLLSSTLAEAESAYVQLHEHHAALMRFIAEMHYPVPKPLKTAAEMAINAGLRKALSSDEVDAARVASLLEEAPLWEAEIDSVSLSFTLAQTLERLAHDFGETPGDSARIVRLADVVRLALTAGLSVDIATAQNRFFEALHTVYPPMKRRAENGDPSAREWVDAFAGLGNLLRVRVE